MGHIRSTEYPSDRSVIRHTYSCVLDLFNKTYLKSRANALKLCDSINCVQDRNNNKTKYFCCKNYFGNMLSMDVKWDTPQLPDKMLSEINCSLLQIYTALRS